MNKSILNIKSYFFNLLSLMRIFNVFGLLLVFFPAFFGLLFGFHNTSNVFSLCDKIKIIVIFFVGSVLTRSAGCLINDIVDKNIDSKVKRTKNRPLANKSLKIKNILIPLGIILSLALYILISLDFISILIGTLAFIMILIYPFMKRIFSIPQIFLGLTFNLGSLIGYSYVVGKIDYISSLVYISCIFWTLSYDTIYSFADLEDDKQLGVHSSGIFFENKKYKLFIFLGYIAFFSLIFISYNIISHMSKFLLVLEIFAILQIITLVIWQIQTLDIKDANNCITRFKRNVHLGFIISALLMFLSLTSSTY